jgi:hypothetical protein
VFSVLAQKILVGLGPCGWTKKPAPFSAILLRYSRQAASMLVLYETPAGFSLFKVLDEGKLKKSDDLWKDFQDSDKARKM